MKVVTSLQLYNSVYIRTEETKKLVFSASFVDNTTITKIKNKQRAKTEKEEGEKQRNLKSRQ